MTESLPQNAPKRTPARRDLAAMLLAEDDLSDEEIAKRVGISRRTLSNWKLESDFSALVGDYIGQLQAAMLRYRIAKKRERIKVLDRLHSGLLTVVDERADEYAGVAPGGSTGTIVRQIKQIGAGRDAQIIEEFAVDVGTIRQIMALEEQVAKELGQWVEKSQVEDLTRIVEIVGVESEAI